MRAATFTLMLLASGAAFGTTLYKWVDANGTIHYSDRPMEGATTIQIETSPPRPPQSSAAAARATPRSGSDGTAEPFRYESCAVTSPKADEVFMNTFSVSTAWTIRPALRPGDQVRVALNGALLQGISPGASSFTIAPIDRGTHTLMVSIVDAQGRGVCQSPGVTFHVRQASLHSPARQNMARPPAPRGN